MRDSTSASVSTLWEEGLSHFRRGNYYAARDLWKMSLNEASSIREKARISNSLGAAEFYLQGCETARVYFERANALSLRSETPDPLRIRYLTNLAMMHIQMDHIDAAVQTSLEAVELVSKERPLESAHAMTISVYAFLRHELYREVIHLHDGWLEISELLPDGQRDRRTASFLHNLGFAAQAMNDMESAQYFYLQSIESFSLPETLRELSRLYLLQGDVENSIIYSDQLYDSVWGFAMLTQSPELIAQKSELAYSLVLVGMFAYYANHRALFERCIEKAELYFGQMSRWDEWLRMRELDSSLAARRVNVPAAAFDWDRWNRFLDDLTLLDSLESLFPNVVRMTHTATNLAEHLAEEIDVDMRIHRKRLQGAGRMAYVGLTAMSASESEARYILMNRDSKREMTDLSVRLLEIYPQSDAYRGLIEYTGTPDVGRTLSPEDTKLAQCLAMAFDYVQCMEFESRSHDDAVQSLVEEAQQNYDSDVVRAFWKHMATTETGA
jgi:tetratricopeptide (TPR) repeat protein